MYEFIEITAGNLFDPSSITSDVPFTQAQFYGGWQESLGRTVLRFSVQKDKKIVAYFQVIKYKLIKDKSYFYIPYGPVTNDTSEDFLKALKAKLIELAKAHSVVFIRLDFTPKIDEKILAKFFKKSPYYTYHSAYFQPRLEWHLGLSGTEEEIYNGMHDKTRYSIRASEKREITTELITSNFKPYFERFFELMTETASRNGFNIHSRAYYENIFNDLEKVKDSYIVIARYKEQILVVDLFIVYGGVTNYVYGASSNEERTRMPSYAAQWTAIRHAKALGCSAYNFGGIANEASVYKGWDGLTKFKVRFGGYEVLHTDFYDIVVKSLWYNLYNFRKWINKIKK